MESLKFWSAQIKMEASTLAAVQVLTLLNRSPSPVMSMKSSTNSMKTQKSMTVLNLPESQSQMGKDSTKTTWLRITMRTIRSICNFRPTRSNHPWSLLMLTTMTLSSSKRRVFRMGAITNLATKARIMRALAPTSTTGKKLKRTKNEEGGWLWLLRPHISLERPVCLYVFLY